MAGLVSRVTVALAVAGGALVLALAGLVTISVLMRWLGGRNVPGDFELVQMGISLATFAFLPLCQFRGQNIVVDTFTAWMPQGAGAFLDGLWALAYAGVACLITARMAAGALETLASGTTTMVLALPIGWAILVAAVSSAWLAAVALFTAALAFRRARS